MIFPKILFLFFGSDPRPSSSLWPSFEGINASFIFLFAIARVNICIVPLSLVHAKNLDWGSKAMLYIVAFSVPLLNSWTKVPSSILNKRSKVPLSEAVAKRVPSLLMERHAIWDSCAFNKDVSGFWELYDLIRTYPFDLSGYAMIVSSIFADIATTPFGFWKVSMISIFSKVGKMKTKILFSHTTKSLIIYH